MYCEIPVFKRCCCCLPLRHGLLAFAYFKLILLALLMLGQWLDPYTRSTELGFILMQTFTFVEVILTLVLVVGGQMKKTLPMKIYMWYAIIGAVLTLVYVLHIIRLVASIAEDPEVIVEHALPYISMFFLSFVIQLYIVVLIRSQILKLQSAEETVKYELGNDCVNVGLKV